MTKWAMLFAFFMIVFADRSSYDEDCQSLCKLLGGCKGGGSYCNSRQVCTSIYNFKTGLCLHVSGDDSCPTRSPLRCSKAAKFNPDRACERVVSGSYCKIQGDGTRICHNIGRTSSGKPCALDTLGCKDTAPFTCDEAIAGRRKSTKGRH